MFKHWLIKFFMIYTMYESSFGQNLADSLANNKTKQILAYIAGLPQQGKVLSGQFAGYSPDTFSIDIINQISQQIGQVPSILGCDYACGWNYKTPPETLIDYSCNPALKNHWDAGGLVTINMHLPNPVSSNGGGIKDKMNLNFADLLNNATSTGQRWRLFLDRIAQGLDDLQQSGVTVLFRPFHEMNGEWFFWGAQDPQTFKNVWIDMFNYLTTTKTLHNLLWVYSPGENRDNKLTYYPGSAYVDIVGLDAYLDDPNTMSGYAEMISLNKTFVLGEVGPSTVNGQFQYTQWLTAIGTKYPQIAYLFAWNDGWAPISNLYPCAFYNNHLVLNRGDLTLNNYLIITTPQSTTSSQTTTSTASSSVVIYNFSNGIGQWQGYNVVGGPWESSEFTYASTDSLKCDILLYSGSKYYIYTNQASTFTLANYKKLVGHARVANWGFNGGTMVGKLYIKTGSSWQWYDSGALQLNSNTATTLTLDLISIPSTALADIREVGIEYTSSADGYQTSVYFAYVTAAN